MFLVLYDHGCGLLAFQIYTHLIKLCMVSQIFSFLMVDRYVGVQGVLRLMLFATELAKVGECVGEVDALHVVEDVALL